MRQDELVKTLRAYIDVACRMSDYDEDTAYHQKQIDRLVVLHRSHNVADCRGSCAICREVMQLQYRIPRDRNGEGQEMDDTLVTKIVEIADAFAAWHRHPTTQLQPH